MDWLIVSNLLLWGLVVFLTIVVLTLARQISLLNYHGEPKSNVIPPSMIKIGEVTREIKGIDLDGKLVEVGGPNTNNFNLVVFISPICPVSKALATAAISLTEREKIDLIFVGGGRSISLSEHQNFAVEIGLENHYYLVSDTLGIHFGIHEVPFALFINEKGVLVGKGLVNTREHLEHLVKEKVSGVSASQ